MNIGLTIAGWVAAALLGWLWLGARDDLSREIERCNTTKVAAVADAEKLARQATQAAADRRIMQIQAQVAQEREAREIAAQALQEAQNRPERVREVVRRVKDETNCLNQPVPADVIRLLD